MEKATLRKTTGRSRNNRLMLNAETSLQIAMQHWLEFEKFSSVERTTYDRYECTARNQIYPFLGEYELSYLTRDDFKELLDDSVLAGYAYTTVKKTHGLLKSLMERSRT